MYLYETLHFVKQRDKASMVMEVQLNASNEIPSWKVTHPTWETDVGRICWFTEGTPYQSLSFDFPSQSGSRSLGKPKLSCESFQC